MARWKRSRATTRAAAWRSASCAWSRASRRPISPAPSRWRRPRPRQTSGRGGFPIRSPRLHRAGCGCGHGPVRAAARSGRLRRRRRRRCAAGRRGRRGMNRFAELLDRLAYEPGRNNKLRLITSYFREVEDPDRGYALAALTGALSFKHAKPGLIRDLIADRTDPVLFALSYDYVGDLSETVALMWPKTALNREVSLPGHPSPHPSPARGEGAEQSSARPPRKKSKAAATTLSRDSAATTLSVPSPLAGKGQGEGYRAHRAHDDQRLHRHNNPPPPTLTDVVTTLRTLGKTELPKQLTRWLDELDETGRWALLKLVTGAMRIGISARLAKTAAAALGDKDPHDVELMWP